MWRIFCRAMDGLVLPAKGRSSACASLEHGHSGLQGEKSAERDSGSDYSQDSSVMRGVAKTQVLLQSLSVTASNVDLLAALSAFWWILLNPQIPSQLLS